MRGMFYFVEIGDMRDLCVTKNKAVIYLSASK